jgi:hypothetical protein
MDENQQDNNGISTEVLPPDKSLKAREDPTIGLIPPPEKRFDESSIIFRTIKTEKGEKITLENFQAWQQKAFWLLYTKKETNLTLSEIGKMVGKSRETICRFGRSIEYRRIAGDTSCLDFERMTPVALKRLEIILKFSTNEKLVAEQARWVIERGLEERSLREKLNEIEKQPRNVTQVNIDNWNDMSGSQFKNLRGVRADLVKKLEALLGSSQQTEGDRADTSRNKAH